MKITYVICCFNSSTRIVETLDCIRRTQVSEYNIVVVDNACTDNTSETVSEWMKTHGLNKIQIKIVLELKPGLANARVKGLNESNGDFIIFVDDDMSLVNDWGRTVKETFAGDPNIGLIGGLGLADDLPKPWWFKTFEAGYALGPQNETEGEVRRGWIYGAGLCLRRSVWNQLTLSGFKFTVTGRSENNLMSGEDNELCYAFRLLGYKITYSADLKFVHRIGQNRLTEMYVQSLQQGFGRSSVQCDAYLDALANRSVQSVLYRYFARLLKLTCKDQLLGLLSLMAGNQLKFLIETKRCFIISRLLQMRLWGHKRYCSQFLFIRDAEWHRRLGAIPAIDQPMQ